MFNVHAIVSRRCLTKLEEKQEVNVTVHLNCAIYSENALYTVYRETLPIQDLCFRFRMFCSLSGIQAATYAYVTEFQANERKSYAVSFVTMFLPAVFVYLALLAWLIVPMPWTIWLFNLKFSPWRLYLICSTTLNVFNFIAVSLLPESPKFLLSMERKEEAMNVLRKVYEINTGSNYDVRTNVHLQRSSDRPKPSIR